jgi:hypothetical protein
MRKRKLIVPIDAAAGSAWLPGRHGGHGHVVSPPASSGPGVPTAFTLEQGGALSLEQGGTFELEIAA